MKNVLLLVGIVLLLDDFNLGQKTSGRNNRMAVRVQVPFVEADQTKGFDIIRREEGVVHGFAVGLFRGCAVKIENAKLCILLNLVVNLLLNQILLVLGQRLLDRLQHELTTLRSRLLDTRGSPTSRDLQCCNRGTLDNVQGTVKCWSSSYRHIDI